MLFCAAFLHLYHCMATENNVGHLAIDPVVIPAPLEATSKSLNVFDHCPLCPVRQLRIHRNRQRLQRRLLADREITSPIAQVSEALLQVHWRRTVDFRPDRLRLEMRHPRITPLAADHKLVVDVAAKADIVGQTDVNAGGGEPLMP